MRTTVEIPDTLRLKLIQAAAEAGEKGYSRIIAAALELYFSAESRRARNERVYELFGVESDQAPSISESARGRWRTGTLVAEEAVRYGE